MEVGNFESTKQKWLQADEIEHAYPTGGKKKPE